MKTGVMNSNVRVEYKFVGQSMGGLIQEIKDKYPGRKVCYSGRLDVVACGLVHILFDEEVKLASEYNKRGKYYMFRVVVGIQTDTTSPLGIIEDIRDICYDTGTICKCIEEFLIMEGVQKQEFHSWSSKPYKTIECGSKPLWWYSREDKFDELVEDVPKKEITIHEIIFEDFQVYPIRKLIHGCKNIVKETIRHNNLQYRTYEIYEQWCQLYQQCKQQKHKKKMENMINYNFDVIELRFDCHVSSGTYIRQIIKDVSKKMGMPMMALEINRYKLE